MRLTKTNILLGGLAAACLFTTINAQAQLLASDNFDYTAGSALTGQNGGTGFSSAYTANGSGLTVGTSNLTYTDTNGASLVSSGLAAALSGGNNGVFRTLSSTLGGGNSTIWLSFEGLLNTTTAYAGVSLFTGTGGTENVFFGNGSTNGIPAVNLESTGPQSGAGETSLANPNQFVVAELEFGTAAAGGSGVTVNLFDDPVLGTTPTTPSFTESNATSFTFNTIRIQSGADAGEIDELRIGDTFADVAPLAPVPEPTTFALSLLGAAGLIGLVIRRRLA